MIPDIKLGSEIHLQIPMYELRVESFQDLNQ